MRPGVARLKVKTYHSTLPNSSFTAKLLSDVQFDSLSWTGHRGLDIRDTNTSSFAHCNKHTSVVPIVAVTTKTGDDGVSKHCQAGPLKNSSAKEVSRNIVRNKQL